VLGTVKTENGTVLNNWSKIDELYDDMLARDNKPFVELGFTPKALATSPNNGSPPWGGSKDRDHAAKRV
jgi:xylan 1,4-beta-xylosidase